MGTQDPLVRIEAATLAGGDNNQDRYAYGDGWAFVLDGASSFGEHHPLHDGGWYAERLKRALVHELSSHNERETPQLVSRAIHKASSGHDERNEGACPTSTIVLTRWDKEEIELYALGDSYAATLSPTGKVMNLIQDSRIDEFGREIRKAYKRRLLQGSGFDEIHRGLLEELQSAQGKARNTPGGYWIAGAVPQASQQGFSIKTKLVSGGCVLLFTDGLTCSQTPEMVIQAASEAAQLEGYIQRLQLIEEQDWNGMQIPRSKRHDDKTIVKITYLS